MIPVNPDRFLQDLHTLRGFGAAGRQQLHHHVEVARHVSRKGWLGASWQSKRRCIDQTR